MLMIPDENFLKPSGSNNLFETPSLECYPMQSTKIYAKTSPSASLTKVAPLCSLVTDTCAVEKEDLSLPNQLFSFLAKDSGIDDCFEEEDPNGFKPNNLDLIVYDEKELETPLGSIEGCDKDQQQRGNNCYAILCFLPDLAGFKGLILSQSPSQSTSPDVANKNFECYLKRLLNPLWRQPPHPKDEQELPHDHVITNCYPNHVIIGKRVWESHTSHPRILITDTERKSRFSLPSILPSMVDMAIRPPMLTISEQVDSGLEPCGDNVDDECLSMKINGKEKDVLPEHAATDDQIMAGKDVIFSLEAREHDTNHNFNIGNVTLSLSPQQGAQSTLKTPTTSSIPNHQSHSTNINNDDDNVSERYKHIQELLISNPSLFHGSISSPELSSIYRAKRISHGDILASILRHLALLGPNVAFRTQHLYKSDRANLIIARSLSKDLVDKGCFVCAGPITINFPPLPSSVSPVAAKEFKFSNSSLPDNDTLGVEKPATRRKRFPIFLENYNATTTPQNNSIKHSPNREDTYDPTDNFFYPYL